jgi:hypothetical protein
MERRIEILVLRSIAVGPMDGSLGTGVFSDGTTEFA